MISCIENKSVHYCCSWLNSCSSSYFVCEYPLNIPILRFTCFGFDIKKRPELVKRTCPPRWGRNEFHPWLDISPIHWVLLAFPKKIFLFECFQKSGENPQNGWSISWKTLLKWMFWGAKTPIFGNTHLLLSLAFYKVAPLSCWHGGCFSTGITSRAGRYKEVMAWIGIASNVLSFLGIQTPISLWTIAPWQSSQFSCMFVCRNTTSPS